MQIVVKIGEGSGEDPGVDRGEHPFYDVQNENSQILHPELNIKKNIGYLFGQIPFVSLLIPWKGPNPMIDLKHIKLQKLNLWATIIENTQFLRPDPKR